MADLALLRVSVVDAPGETRQSQQQKDRQTRERQTDLRAVIPQPHVVETAAVAIRPSERETVRERVDAGDGE